jgi:hypothetical protein
VSGAGLARAGLGPGYGPGWAGLFYTLFYLFSFIFVFYFSVLDFEKATLVCFERF